MAVAAVENAPLRAAPKAVAAAMVARPTRGAMRPYSMAVAPRSSWILEHG